MTERRVAAEAWQILLPKKVCKLYIAAAARRRVVTAAAERSMSPQELAADILCHVALHGSIWANSLYSSRDLDTEKEGEQLGNAI
jgi:hypothetical protein